MKKSTYTELQLAPSFVLKAEIVSIKVRSLRQGITNNRCKNSISKNLTFYSPIIVRERARKAGSYEVLNIGDSRIEAFINELHGETTLLVHILTETHSKEELNEIRHLTTNVIPYITPERPVQKALEKLVASPELTAFINIIFKITPRKGKQFSISGIRRVLGSSAPAINTLRKIVAKDTAVVNTHGSIPHTLLHEQKWDRIAQKNGYPTLNRVIEKLQNHKQDINRFLTALADCGDTDNEIYEYAQSVLRYIRRLDLGVSQ